MVCRGRRRPTGALSGVLAGGRCDRRPVRATAGPRRQRPGARCRHRCVVCRASRRVRGRGAGVPALRARCGRHPDVPSTHASGAPHRAPGAAGPGEHACRGTRVGGVLCWARVRRAAPRRHRYYRLSGGVRRNDADLGGTRWFRPEDRRDDAAAGLVAGAADPDGRATLATRIPDPPGDGGRSRRQPARRAATQRCWCAYPPGSIWVAPGRSDCCHSPKERAHSGRSLPSSVRCRAVVVRSFPSRPQRSPSVCWPRPASCPSRSSPVARSAPRSSPPKW